MKTVALQLSSAGADVVQFDIICDGSVPPFSDILASGIPKATLFAGINIDVPDATTTMRITSTGVCTNSQDIFLNTPTTSTTTSSTSSTTSTTTSSTSSTTTSSTTAVPVAPTIFNIFPAIDEGAGLNPRDKYWSSQIIGEDEPISVALQAVQTSFTGGSGKIYISTDTTPDFESKVWAPIIGVGGVNPYTLNFVGGIYVYFKVIAGSSVGDTTNMTVTIASTTVGAVGSPAAIYLSSTTGSNTTTSTTTLI